MEKLRFCDSGRKRVPKRYVYKGFCASGETQCKSLFSILFLSGALFAQSEAYIALKVLEPLIGEWMSKHKSLGVFEGEPDNQAIVSSYSFEWVTDKTAILETWRSSTEKDSKRIHTGSILYTLDPSSNTI